LHHLSEQLPRERVEIRFDVAGVLELEHGVVYRVRGLI
jgi:hypothetical protein